MRWFERFLGRADRADSLNPADLQALAEARSAEDVATVSMEWLNRTIRPLAAYAYVWNSSEGEYRMVASVTPGTSALSEPEPHYSGLMAGAPTAAGVPLALSAADAPPAVEVADLGEERWLIVPLGSACLLRASLVRRGRFPPALLDQVRHFAQIASPMATIAQRVTEAQSELDRLNYSLKAAHVAAQSVFQSDRSLQTLFQLPMGLLGAKDACLIVPDSGEAQASVMMAAGQGADLGILILSGGPDPVLEIPAEPDYLAGAALGDLGETGFTALVRMPAVHQGELRGCAFYFFRERPSLSAYQLNVVATIGHRLGQVMGNAQVMADTSAQYLETLHALVDAMDSLSPYTVGHSDRMARYARLIAREMGLSAENVEAIALAAYLHDAGMLALDLALLSSSTRLTPEQFDEVKQHAELGAELVGVLQASIPIAGAILHHHERWDGRGYPHRLRGREIPLGARIIAVCDLFEAKTTSRPHRKALPVARALQDLQAAAGTQLDADVVAAFTRGMQRLGRSSGPGLPMERCWVVRQIPAEVCGACPNRASAVPVACWENPDKLCTRHGDECAHCSVYTEVLSRSAFN